MYNVKREVKRHVEKRFHEYISRRPSLSDFPFHMLDEGDIFMLEALFFL